VLFFDQQHNLWYDGKVKSTRSLAKEGALSHQELRTLQKEGVDINEPVTRESRERNKAKLEAARVEKVQLESELIRSKIARQNGELIPVDQVREDVIAAVAAFTAELYALANDVPGQLVGLSEVGIRDKMLTRIDLLVDKVREKCTELGKARMEGDEADSL
jgi:hypothetical protein